MKPALAVLFFLLPSRCVFAATLQCRANFDESSHYEITGTVPQASSFELRYLTSDGLDLRSPMQAKAVSYEEESALSLTAASDSMGMALKTSFDSGKRVYRGILSISFQLDNAEPVDLDAICLVH